VKKQQIPKIIFHRLAKNRSAFDKKSLVPFCALDITKI